MSKKKAVSIIIRTKNEERWIKPCFDAINRQTYKNFEIIVVDNKSVDNTLKKVRNYKIAKILEIDHYFPGKALNIGINKSEGKINWKEDATTICAKVNGLYPNPGAWFEFNSERFKILKSDISSLQGEPGMVLDDNLTIACGKDSILINEIQRQGKTAQNIKNFLLGNKIQKGFNLNDE